MGNEKDEILAYPYSVDGHLIVVPLILVFLYSLPRGT